MDTFTFACPIDPEHPTRIETPMVGARTGYCILCAVHTELCNEFKHMEICTQPKGHGSMHISAQGTIWTTIPQAP